MNKPAVIVGALLSVGSVIATFVTSGVVQQVAGASAVALGAVTLFLGRSLLSR